MAKLIIVGQVPPPFYGQSVMIKAMIDGLSELDYLHIPLRFSKEVNQHGRFAVGKLFYLIGITFVIAFHLLRHRKAVLYFPAPPPKWSTVLRDLIILSMCRPLAGAVVFHFHAYGLGDFLEHHPWLDRLGWALRKPDAAVVLGHLCRRDAEVIEARRVCEIPYGIDVPVIEAKGRRENENVRILFVGLHIPSKGIGDLLEVARILKERGLNFEVHTAGPWRSPQIKQQLVQRQKDAGVEDVVRFRGELTGDTLWEEYAEADILFFPTFYEFETFGVVVLEAMAYGLPVVASNWRGPGDLVEDGVTGLLCESRDIEGYANALASLVADADRRKALGHAAKEQYNKKYNAAVYAQAMQNVFEKLMVEQRDG